MIKPCRPVEEDRAHRPDDHLVGGEGAVVEAVGDGARRKRLAGLHELGGTRPHRGCLRARQPARPVDEQEVVVVEQPREVGRKSGYRRGHDAGLREGRGLARQDPLDLAQA